MAEKKTCTRCRRKKDPSEFYAHPATLDRLQSQCKACMGTAANRRNKAKREELKRLGRS